MLRINSTPKMEKRSVWVYFYDLFGFSQMNAILDSRLSLARV